MRTYTGTFAELIGNNSSAGSVVTLREATGDKSITLDMSEKTVLYKKIPANEIARRGLDVPDGLDIHKTFNLVINCISMEFKEVELVVVYPKKKGNETRLYFKKDAPFYPSTGDVCFIVADENYGHPFIGFLPEAEYNVHKSTDPNIVAHVSAISIDETDGHYQHEVSTPAQLPAGYRPKIKKKRSAKKEVGGRAVPARDAELARWYLADRKYECEVDRTHTTFISGASQKPYMEVHHYVPVSQEDKVAGEWSLDVPSNLMALCPTCHRAFHHGDKTIKSELITDFWKRKEKGLRAAGIQTTLEDVLGYYGIE